MSELSSCRTCGKMYRADQLAYCPHCGTEAARQGKIKVTPELSPGKTKSNTLNTKLDSAPLDISQLVRAQNRTTHAVRSLSVFFFTTLLTLIIGSAMVVGSIVSQTQCRISVYDQSNCGDNSGVVLGFLLILAGFIAGLWFGLKELDKSNIA